MSRGDRSPHLGRLGLWGFGLAAILVSGVAAVPWLAGKHLVGFRAFIPRDGPEGGAEPRRRPDFPVSAEIDAARVSAETAARIEQSNLSRADFFAPREDHATSDGDHVAPFEGFGLSIASTPGGARVIVNGEEMGETPLVTTVDCEPGDSVEVVVRKRGFRASNRQVRCRKDSLLEIAVALLPASARR
ncbi:MAG TPA: PEGA domain-containing protein [Anaeromyxobacteraceae bacterium]|nr:PEGA domain-containing protein [Anaeromyxobacteraceae bacterium]